MNHARNRNPWVLSALGAILIALTMPSTSSAAVIFNDTSDFSNWHTGGTNGTLSTVSEELSWAVAGSSADQVIGRSFAPTTLSVGESMTFSFNWRQDVASVSIFRIGLFDTATPVGADDWGGTLVPFFGYDSFVRDNDGTKNPARVTTNQGTTDPLVQTGTEIGSNTTIYDINQDGTVTYDVSYTLTYTSASQMDTLLTLSSGSTTHMSVSGTTSTIYDSFDGAFIRSSGGTMLLDNLSVTVIPEPASTALLLLGAALLIRRRRK